MRIAPQGPGRVAQAFLQQPVVEGAGGGVQIGGGPGLFGLGLLAQPSHFALQVANAIGQFALALDQFGHLPAVEPGP